MDPRFLPKNIQKQIPGTPAYRKEKENSMMKQDISRANQQLQQMLAGLKQEINEDEYKDMVIQHSRNTVQSLIVPLRYRNNFENIQVLYDGVLLLLKLILKSKSEKRFNIQFQKHMLHRFGNHLQLLKIKELEKQIHSK